METIYIGTKYSNGIRLRDNTALSKPYVVLYNPSTKRWYTASSYSPNTESATRYTFVFSPEVTAQMVQGKYHLEVYSDSSKTKMLKRIECFAEAVQVAATNGSIAPN